MIKKMLYIEKANFILPAGAIFMLALDVSASSFSVSFVEFQNVL